MEHHLVTIALSLLLTITEVLSDNGPNCPEIYQRFSTSHSYCQPKNPSCNILQSGINQKDKNHIVDIHNHYRSVIATQGKESNGLPPAADMIYMEWDDELAAIAQKRAESCIYDHDNPDQRRVRNFGVGQNIAQMNVTGATEQPKPDWDAAIAGFYNEIKFVSKDMICGNRKTPPDQVIGHFTQLVWAKTFRVGCGYTMYKYRDTFIRLYYCNYGPGGNVDSSCVYKDGQACSKCPINTKCSADSQHPGLCKRINNKAPEMPITEPTIFNCNFNNPSSPDCQLYFTGDGPWSYIPALGGQFIESVLQPGQNSTIVFSKKLEATSGAQKMCVQLRYRKGPTLAKNQQNNQAKGLFVIPSFSDFTAVLNLKSYDGNARQQFTKFSYNMGWKEPTDMKISFAVPKGATPQFFNLISIVGFNNKCKDLEY